MELIFCGLLLIGLKGFFFFFSNFNGEGVFQFQRRWSLIFKGFFVDGFEGIVYMELCKAYRVS